MTLQARDAKVETSVDNRRRRRHKLFLEAEARAPNESAGAVTVYDISDTGLLIETNALMAVGEIIEVNIPHAGFRLAEVVWASGQLVGCQFAEKLSPGAVSAARLGGSFARPAPNELVRDALALGVKDNDLPEASKFRNLSPSARVWVIIGLALLSWAIVGGIVFAILR